MDAPKRYDELRGAMLKLAAICKANDLPYLFVATLAPHVYATSMSLDFADRGIGPKELSRAIAAVTEASAEDGGVE